MTETTAPPAAAPPAAPASPPDAAPPVPPLTSWASETSQLRDATKWVIGALAGAGTLLFGASTLLARPALSWHDPAERLQLLAACGLAVVAVASLVTLVSVLATLLTPRIIRLDTLDPAFVALVDAAPQWYLPHGCASVAQFRTELPLVREEARRVATDHRRDVADLAALAARAPAGPEEAAQHERRARELQDRIDADEHFVPTSRDREATYARAARDLLDEARTRSTSALTTSRRVVVGVLAAVAGIAGVGFQLMLSTPAPPADDAGDVTPAGQVAYLVEAVSPAGEQLWDALDLEACALPGDGASPEVPVLVTGGTGSAADPWTVTTVRVADGCAVLTFPVAQADVVVRQPTATVVEVRPAPSSTP